MMNESATDLINAFERLWKYLEREDYAGWDPYDALTGWTDFRFAGRQVPAVIVQLHKRNPVNLRRLLAIRKQRNAKAIGLMLQAYCLLTEGNQTVSNHSRGKSSHAADRVAAGSLFNWLYENRSASGSGWGYPFPWASPEKYLPVGTPSAVVTGSVIQGVHAWYRLTSEPRALELMQESARFVCDDLLRTETDDGLCFSYTAVKRDCCYNASLLAAEVLARLYSVNKDTSLRDLVQRAVAFVLAHQQTDGRWNYSLNPETGYERAQIDFHQGFVLDSLIACQRFAQLEDLAISRAISQGVMFYYQNQFLSDGRALWRYPKRWPVEIHNQAQGIITFSRLAHLDAAYLPFAHTIADWTIRNMQDQQGFFYYQKHRFYTNRIPYMRWSQVWMFLALTMLLGAEYNKE